MPKLSACTKINWTHAIYVFWMHSINFKHILSILNMLNLLVQVQYMYARNQRPSYTYGLNQWSLVLYLGSKGTQSNQSHHSPVVEKREQEEKTIKSHSKSKALLTFFFRLWTVLSPTSWITSSSTSSFLEWWLWLVSSMSFRFPFNIPVLFYNDYFS